MANKKRVVIVGASGLVGYACVKHFASHSDCDVVVISRKPPAKLGKNTFISLDLTNRDECARVFTSVSDATHLYMQLCTN